MNDVDDIDQVIDVDQVRSLLGRGNYFASQGQWGTAMAMFEQAVAAIVLIRSNKANKITISSELYSYALAHCANARVKKLVDLYGLRQVLNSAAISALDKVAEMYESAIEQNGNNAWAYAHRGEMNRLVANCVFEGSQLIDERMRIKRYKDSINDFCNAIDIYRKSCPGKNDSRIAWASAHLAAVVVNSRAFVGFPCNEDPFDGSTLARICKAAGMEDVPINPGGMTAIAVCETSLKAAERLLVFALSIEGFYYPWAHCYYGSSLLLRSAISQPSSAPVDIANLGQVITSHAYYLNPSLLTGIFEPAHLAVNPPFELALIYFGKAINCEAGHPNACALLRQAWAFAWISLNWPFKFFFLEGLQTLTVYSLLAQICSQYIAINDSLSMNIKETNTDGILEYLGFQSPLPFLMESRARSYHEIITTQSDLDEFIGTAIERFCAIQLDFILKNEIELDDNLKTDLVTAAVWLHQMKSLCKSKKINQYIWNVILQIKYKLLKGSKSPALDAFRDIYEWVSEELDDIQDIGRPAGADDARPSLAQMSLFSLLARSPVTAHALHLLHDRQPSRLRPVKLLSGAAR